MSPHEIRDRTTRRVLPANAGMSQIRPPHSRRGRECSRESTVHPLDLTLTREGQEWLVEVKVVYKGNATDEVRAVVAQLFEYRHSTVRVSSHQYWSGCSRSGSVAYVEFLELHGIRSGWSVSGGTVPHWRGRRASCRQSGTPMSWMLWVPCWKTCFVLHGTVAAATTRRAWVSTPMTILV